MTRSDRSTRHSEAAGGTFRRAQPILFRHCDPAGIVFYPRYFEFVNDLVEAWFDDGLGQPFAEMLRTHGVPTAEIAATFHAPSRHGETLDLALSVTRLGRSSAGIAVRGTHDGAPRFTTRSTLVYVGPDGPVPWPGPLRAAIDSFRTEET